MGMFDKDKEMGLILDQFFSEKEEFIVWSARVKRDDFPTKLGNAVQSEFSASRISDPRVKYEVTTLASAVGDKVKEADDDDFPAVVYWTRVPVKTGHALVLQFLRAWDGTGAPRATDTDRAASVAVDPETPSDDDIPFG